MGCLSSRGCMLAPLGLARGEEGVGSQALDGPASKYWGSRVNGYEAFAISWYLEKLGRGDTRLGRPLHQESSTHVVHGNQRRQVKANDLAIAHPLNPIYDSQVHVLRLAENQGRNRIV
jgi:hypothetical protein